MFYNYFNWPPLWNGLTDFAYWQTQPRFCTQEPVCNILFACFARSSNNNYWEENSFITSLSYKNVKSTMSPWKRLEPKVKVQTWVSYGQLTQLGRQWPVSVGFMKVRTCPLVPTTTGAYKRSRLVSSTLQHNGNQEQWKDKIEEYWVKRDGIFNYFHILCTALLKYIRVLPFLYS